jgi:hypothetical protein
MRARPNRLDWALLLGGTAVVLGVQLHHTLRNTNRWPWCSYNMFSYRKRATAQQLRTRLITERGSIVGPADPWGLLPLEFFRVVALLERLFFTEDDQAARERFCRQTLDRLNRRPWGGWDEVKAALVVPAGERFVALELYLVDIDFDRCEPADRTHVVAVELVHRHDPLGVAATVPPVRWRLLETVPAQEGSRP